MQSVSGEQLLVEGCIDLPIVIGGVKVIQKCYIISGMNRNMLLGRDFLRNNGVRLYFDLGCLRINGVYVPLEEDIHIASLIRLKHKIILKPQTANVCSGKLQRNICGNTAAMCEVSNVERGYINSEPGLMVGTSIAKINGSRSIPILVVNGTNKTIKLRRGSVIAKAESVGEHCSITSCDVATNCPKRLTPESLSDVNVPVQYKSKVIPLLRRNSDLFAISDNDLTTTDTVQMEIDTGSHPPIQLRPYRAPLTSRQTIGKAIDQMLSAGIIRESQSSWSFPVVIVNKKDGTKRFCVDFRKLNQITKPMVYPLPLIDDLLASLGKAKYFSNLDLRSA